MTPAGFSLLKTVFRPIAPDCGKVFISARVRIAPVFDSWLVEGAGKGHLTMTRLGENPHFSELNVLPIFTPLTSEGQIYFALNSKRGKKRQNV